MPFNQPTLFGVYPWALGNTSSPVLYGTGYVSHTDTISVSDSMSESDADNFTATIPFADDLLLKEWISMRLLNDTNWVNLLANANIFDTLWGKYQYGRVLFGGLKPLASWSRGPVGKRPSVWTNSNGHKYNI